MRIFTQIGELVDNLSLNGQGRIDNEIKWDLTNINSGVYYAEISAESDTKSSKKIIKIAVIK